MTFLEIRPTKSELKSSAAKFDAAALKANQSENARRHEFYEASPDAVVVVDHTGCIIFANSRVEAMLGYLPIELLGMPQSILVPERFRDAHAGHIDHFMQAPSPRMMGVGLELSALHKDGSERLIEISLSPHQSSEGVVVVAAMRGVTISSLKSDALEIENSNLRDLLGLARSDVRRLLKQAGIDAFEHETGSRLQRLLLEELHHRVKNMMATVMAITSQSLRNAKDLEEGRVAIASRLTAMGRAQDLLLATDETGAKLVDVIDAAIEPFNSGDVRRFFVQAIDVDIRPEAVLPITLSVNELCTNAVKYGALSNTVGRIQVASTVDDTTQNFKLIWTEYDGPAVEEVTRRGFGTRLLEVLAKQLGLEVRVNFERNGLVYHLCGPLSCVSVQRIQ